MSVEEGASGWVRESVRRSVLSPEWKDVVMQRTLQTIRSRRARAKAKKRSSPGAASNSGTAANSSKSGESTASAAAARMAELESVSGTDFSQTLFAPREPSLGDEVRDVLHAQVRSMFGAGTQGHVPQLAPGDLDAVGGPADPRPARTGGWGGASRRAQTVADRGGEMDYLSEFSQFGGRAETGWSSDDEPAGVGAMDALDFGFPDSEDEGELAVVRAGRLPPPNMPDPSELEDMIEELYAVLEAELFVVDDTEVVDASTEWVPEVEDVVAEAEAELAAAAAAVLSPVTCPVCCRFPLELAHNILFCRCGVRVNLKNSLAMSLEDIGQCIAGVVDAHQASGCRAVPDFVVEDIQGESYLVCGCRHCNGYDIVV